MPGIMSAEEFNDWLFDDTPHGPDWCEFAHDWQERVDSIRSRDSAMLEKYKEATREAMEHVYQSGVKQGKWLYLNTGPHDPRIPIQPDMDSVINTALDSAFAEIEGGK